MWIELAHERWMELLIAPEGIEMAKIPALND